MEYWITKFGEIKLYELCEEDGLSEEKLDIIHKGLHELIEVEDELNKEQLDASFIKLDELSEED